MKKDHDVIVGELRAFSDVLANKPRIVVANKSDVPEVKERASELAKLLGEKVHVISGVSGEGLKDLLWALYQRVGELKAAREQNAPQDTE